METKQLILEKHCGKVSVIYRINAYAAMQEYAEYYHASHTEMPSEEDIANAIAMSCERMVPVAWDAKKIAARDILKLFKQYLTKD